MESGGTNLHCTRLHAVAQGPLCRPRCKSAHHFSLTPWWL